MAAHGQPLVDPAPANQQHHPLQAHLAAGRGADRGQVQRVLPEGAKDAEAAPAEPLRPMQVVRDPGEAPAQVLGLQDEDPVGQPDQVVHLGPAPAVGARQEQVVRGLGSVAAQQAPDLPLADQAAPPGELGAPRGAGAKEPGHEREGVKAELGEVERARLQRLRPDPHHLGHAAAAVDLHGRPVLRGNGADEPPC